MAFHVRDPDTDRVVRELAALKGASLTDAIREACAAELRSLRPAARPNAGLRARLAPLLTEAAASPAAGPEADKAFYDALSGE